MAFQPNEQKALEGRIVAACQTAGITPRITSTLALIAPGLGVAMVPASMHRIVVDGVVHRPLDSPVTPHGILNVVSRKWDASVVMRRFVEAVREAATAYD